MRAAQFLAIIGRGSKGSNALELTEDRAGATSEQQDNVINTVNSLDPYGPSWQLVPGNVAAGTVYAQVPTSGTGDLTFTRASTATRTNSAGNIVDVASGVGRVDYRNADGSLSPTGRLLLEPQRTNSIRNSTMVGAVAGSPGTLPTNWTVSSPGFTRTVVGTGTENGLSYIDLRFNGIAGAVFTEINFEAIISASAAQSWTNACYLKLIAAPAPPNTYNLFTVNRGASTTIPLQAITPTFNLLRFAQTITTPAGATSVQPGISFGLTLAATYDFTIRIAAPQMELGAYATTFIPTTTAAVTRLADVANKQNIAGTLPTSYPFTLFAEGFLRDSNDVLISINDISTSDIYYQIGATASGFLARARNGGESQAATSSGRTTGTHKVAAVFTASDIKLYANGSLIATAANSITFNTNSNDLLLGQLRNFPDGGQRTPITEAAIIKSALTDAQCIEITTL